MPMSKVVMHQWATANEMTGNANGVLSTGVNRHSRYFHSQDIFKYNASKTRRLRICHQSSLHSPSSTDILFLHTSEKMILYEYNDQSFKKMNTIVEHHFSDSPFLRWYYSMSLLTSNPSWDSEVGRHTHTSM